jgi:CcmD family protein
MTYRTQPIDRLTETPVDTFIVAYTLAWAGLGLYVLRLRAEQRRLGHRLDALAAVRPDLDPDAGA